MTRAAVLSVIALAAGCVSRRDASIHHVVFISLHHPEQAEQFIADSKELRRIPGVRSCAVGRHLNTGRPVVDSEYDVGIYIALDSARAYQQYLTHPIHTKLVDHWRPAWKSVLIRDFAER